MPAEHTAFERPQEDDTEALKIDSMRDADVANGENPDDAAVPSSPTRPDGSGVSHPTGEKQARENADNDPPA